MPKFSLKGMSTQMDILNLTKKARAYYQSAVSKNMYSGYEKNVLVREDTDECVFVNSEYTLMEGDFIFRCRTLNGKTVVDFSKCNVSSLNGIFTEKEWHNMLNSMNGVIVAPELDPEFDIRQAISIEVEETDAELSNKILELSLEDGKKLYELITKFWDHELGYDYFKKISK